MMYTVSYYPCEIGKAIPVRVIGAEVETSRKMEIQFATLDDAYMAAVAVDKAGCINVNVRDTNGRHYAVHDILVMKKKYTPAELCKIDCNIRRLAKEHYLYGASMPLVFGKARGIADVLRSHCFVDASIGYVWDVLSEMFNEPQE